MGSQEKGREHGADINSDQYHCDQDDRQISTHFLTLKCFFWFADEKQVIYVKVNAKKDHGNT
jgi:hypothetical protein